MKILAILVSLMVLLAGCTSTRLDADAKKVYVVPNNQGKFLSEVLNCCRRIGDISCQNIHGSVTPFASDEQLKANDIAFLKANASKVGANVVSFNKHVIIDVPTALQRHGRKYYVKSIHNIYGTAYFCSPKERWDLSRWIMGPGYPY